MSPSSPGYTVPNKQHHASTVWSGWMFYTAMSSCKAEIRFQLYVTNDRSVLGTLILVIYTALFILHCVRRYAVKELDVNFGWCTQFCSCHCYSNMAELCFCGVMESGEVTDSFCVMQTQLLGDVVTLNYSRSEADPVSTSHPELRSGEQSIYWQSASVTMETYTRKLTCYIKRSTLSWNGCIYIQSTLQLVCH